VGNLFAGNLAQEREKKYPINYPLKLPLDEVKEVALDAHWHTEQSDFNFIDQAECITAYRPEPTGIVSSGVRAELQYARGKKRIIVYYDPRKIVTQKAHHFVAMGFSGQTWKMYLMILNVCKRPRIHELLCIVKTA